MRLKAMYKDFITYQLAEGISEAHLLKVAGDIRESWMKKQAGFISWDIHKNTGDNARYTDIILWQSKKYAKNPEKEMVNIPNAGAWFSCHKEGSISSQNLQQRSAF